MALAFHANLLSRSSIFCLQIQESSNEAETQSRSAEVGPPPGMAPKLRFRLFAWLFVPLLNGLID